MVRIRRAAPLFPLVASNRSVAFTGEAELDPGFSYGVGLIMPPGRGARTSLAAAALTWWPAARHRGALR